MSLFQLKNNTVQIDPSLIPIPEFQQLWERDTSRTKSQAYKELAYVYFKADYKSPYLAYPEDQRSKQIAKDFMKDEKWKEDSLVKEAVKKYQQFQETPSTRMLQAARKAQERVIKYFETGKCDVDIKELMGVLDKIGKAVESIDKIEEKVKKETSNAERIRGGGEIKSRER